MTASIVAATDFSESARLAVHRAALLARQRQAPLVVVHAFNAGLWSILCAEFDLLGGAAVHTEATARERLAGLCDELRAEHGIAVRGELLTGRATAAISDFLHECEARLLVVGEHGENWLREAMLGGTALKLMESARLPVLLVRRPATREYGRVVVATDYSTTASRAARLVLDLLPGAQHYLLNAYSVQFEGRMRLAGATDEDIAGFRERERQRAEQGMAAFAIDCDYQAAGQWAPIVAHGYPATVVLEQAHALQADLLAVGKHSGGSVEARLLGSVTQNLLYHADCDVLLVP